MAWPWFEIAMNIENGLMISKLPNRGFAAGFIRYQTSSAEIGLPDGDCPSPPNRQGKQASRDQHHGNLLHPNAQINEMQIAEERCKLPNIGIVWPDSPRQM